MKSLNTKNVIIFSLIIAMFTQRALAKCNNPADLDRTFGPQNNGVVIFNFDNSTNDRGDGGIVIDDQGRIVVSGTQETQFGGRQFGVARLLSNGLLDSTFGPNGDGKVTIDFSGEDSNDRGRGGVVRDTQGRLIVAGYDSFGKKYEVARLLENGALDSSFGTGGKVIESSANTERITGVKLNKNGKIVLFGETTSDDLVVIQLNTNGLLDTSFGDSGMKLINAGGVIFSRSEFIIDPQGKIIVVGSKHGDDDFVIARLNADGSFDTKFGNNGIAIIDIPSSIAINADGGIALTRLGKIIVLGDSKSNSNRSMVAFQLNNDGSLDTAFGTNGSTIVSVSNDDNGEGGITIDSWGNIYLYGADENNHCIILARLKPNGLLDITFGNNGITLIGPKLDAGVPQGGGITIDAQGRIVLLATRRNPGNDLAFAVVRLCGDQLPAFVVALREKYRANCSVLP